MPKRITYIISFVDKALEFEWVSTYLDRTRFELSFIIMNPKPNCTLSQFAKANGQQVIEISYRSKKDIPAAFIKTLWALRQLKTDIVHAHLPEANLVGLAAAKLLGIRKRIYTRHHSTLNHDYHPHAVKYDRWSNAMATDIVAITQNVRRILVDKEGVSPSKITVINHCIDLKEFETVSPERIQNLKAQYQIPEGSLVVGVISRYTRWKGIQYIIPAFKALLADDPQAHLVLANARKGEYVSQITALLDELPQGSYTEITFEKDLYALYQLFDVFVHVPIDEYCEAFGQIYIESLAARIPSIFTLSGVATEFVRHREHAWVVDYQRTDQILEGIKTLLQDHQLRDHMINKSYQHVYEHYSIDQKISSLENLFDA